MSDNSSRREPQNKRQGCWWHPPHQESLHRKESMSDQRSILFLRCIFCDVREFYASNDPCFALYQKQSMAEYTERTTYPHPLTNTFFRLFLMPDEELWDLVKVSVFDTFRDSLILRYVVWDTFSAGQQTDPCCGVSVLLELDKRREKKKLHLNKPSSAVSRVGGCAHWITTLLLLHSIKSDSSSERGSWFDTFLLKQIWRKWGCGWAGALVQSHLFILYGSHGPKQVLMMSWLSASLILKGHFPYLEVVSITWWVQFPISHKTAWVILTIYLGKDDLTVL